MSTVKQITTMLTEVAKGLKSANAAVAKAQEKRAGTYNGAVAVAVEAGDAEKLEKAFDTLFSAIRTDGKLAVACGAKKRKKATKSGEKYTVPSGLQSAKSVLLAAMRYGVPLTDDEGTRAFTQIRNDKATCDAEAKAENASPDEKLRAEIGADLDAIKSGLSDWGSVGLREIGEAIASLRASVTEANEAADDTSEDLAEAA